MIHKLFLFSILYVSILLFIAPFIDHFFNGLDETKSNFTILSEIILQITSLSIVWYYLHDTLKFFIKTKFNIIMKEPSEKLMDFIAAIVLVGLQKNLIQKLEYITYQHPFRTYYFFLSSTCFTDEGSYINVSNHCE